MEEKFDIKKVHINKVVDWNQYITMDSTQEETPTSSIGEGYNELKKDNSKTSGNNLMNGIFEKSGEFEENNNKNSISNQNCNNNSHNDNNGDVRIINKNQNKVSENLVLSKNNNLNLEANIASKEETSTKKNTGNRTRRAEHQSGVPGVYWQESSQRWIAQWSDSITGRRITHGFSSRVYGFEEAKQMAIKSRIDAIEKGKATARKLHESDCNNKLYSNRNHNHRMNIEKHELNFKNKEIHINMKEKRNLQKIMNDMSDEGINLLLEEMKHLKEDGEHEGIFWHPINKIWIGVWLDSITHETCTQSFVYETSEDGVDISRLKAIEWRLKLINEKKLRDNVVEYVNNKEFKYHTNSQTNINNFMNNINGYQPNMFFLQNNYQTIVNQLTQLLYNNNQIDYYTLLSNLLLSNNYNHNNHSKNNVTHQNTQNSFLQMNLINPLILNYLNNYYNFILKQQIYGDNNEYNTNYFDFNQLLPQINNVNISEIKNKYLNNNSFIYNQTQNLLNILQTLNSFKDKTFSNINSEVIEQCTNIPSNLNIEANNIIKKIINQEVDNEIKKNNFEKHINENKSIEKFQSIKETNFPSKSLLFDFSEENLKNVNLTRSITSSSDSSILSNSTNLSLLKNTSNIDTPESITPLIPTSSILNEINSTSPTVTSTPMSSSSKLKILSPKKKNLDNVNYKSGIPGVYWKTRDQEWVAEWYDHNRKRHSRHFYVKKYGFDEAKKLAIQCRLNAVNSGEAVLRSNNQSHVVHNENHFANEENILLNE